MTCLAQSRAAWGLPPYWMVTVDRVPTLGSRKCWCGQGRVQPCTALPLPRDLGTLSVLLLPHLPQSPTFSLGPPTLEPLSLSQDASHPLGEPERGQPRKGPTVS